MYIRVIMDKSAEAQLVLMSCIKSVKGSFTQFTHLQKS